MDSARIVCTRFFVLPFYFSSLATEVEKLQITIALINIALRFGFYLMSCIL